MAREDFKLLLENLSISLRENPSLLARRGRNKRRGD